jgi:hypothetical protein
MLLPFASQSHHHQVHHHTCHQRGTRVVINCISFHQMKSQTRHRHPWASDSYSLAERRFLSSGILVLHNRQKSYAVPQQQTRLGRFPSSNPATRGTFFQAPIRSIPFLSRILQPSLSVQSASSAGLLSPGEPKQACILFPLHPANNAVARCKSRKID